MSRVRTRLEQYKKELERQTQYKAGLPGSALDIINTLLNDLEQDEKENGWIPVSNMPNCCGYQVLLTVENKFGQREVCKAFTNYMKEGKQLFYTNEKEYCAELTSSKLSKALKPIAWMELPEPYKED